MGAIHGLWPNPCPAAQGKNQQDVIFWVLILGSVTKKALFLLCRDPIPDASQTSLSKTHPDKAALEQRQSVSNSHPPHSLLNLHPGLAVLPSPTVPLSMHKWRNCPCSMPRQQGRNEKDKATEQLWLPAPPTWEQGLHVEYFSIVDLHLSRVLV